MNEQVFWKMIEASTQDAISVNDRFRFIENELTAKDLFVLFKFDKILFWLLKKANFEDLWAAYCVLTSEYEEANFLHFKYWLVFQGQRVFKKVINDPEYLEVFSSNFKNQEINLSEYADFQFLAERLYHHKTGLKDYKTANPHELDYESINHQTTTDTELLADLVPLLCKKMGWNTEFYGGKWISDN